MGKFFYSWRFYTYGHERYHECMSNVFVNNLNSLRQANTIVAVFAGCFSLFPILFEKNYFNAAFSIATAVIALLLAVYLNYKMQTAIVENKFIYLFTVIFYINLMAFGIFLGIWSAPDRLATIYLCFLICALLMFINPPLFNLCLTIGAMFAFIILTFINKAAENAIVDIVDTLIAGIISLYFTWHITKLRLGMEISANMLEEERNKYMDQSTIDELTKLKNRRDFMSTFQRYLSNYRTTDDWLCVALSDIDFFKNYNDHYGHPMGDDCLRSVGRVLTNLTENMNVYAARVGGEEFALLWFEKDAAHANEVVSTMSKMIRDMKIPHEKSKVHEFVTMSIGVYIEKCGASNDAKALYELADNALYTAKGSGRNCAIITGREIAQYKLQ